MTRAIAEYVTGIGEIGSRGCRSPSMTIGSSDSHGRQEADRDRSLRASAGALREPQRRGEHARLGVRARAARRDASAKTATSAITCSSRTTSSSAIASRSSAASSCGTASGIERRRVHRAERDVLERQVPAQQAVPATRAADARRDRALDRRRRRRSCPACASARARWSAPARS